MTRKLRLALGAALAALALGGCQNFGYEGGGCEPGERCEICSDDGCECVEGTYCVDDVDCVSGCDLIVNGELQACTMGRCAYYDGRRGYGVCAPADWSPAPAGSCSGTGSDPTCSSSQVAARLDGRVQCLDRCTSNGDCAYCCGRLGDGSLACAPSAPYCGGGGTTTPGPMCSDLSYCIEVLEAIHGELSTCTGTSGLRVRSRNNCDATIMIKTCLERTDGSWDCGLETSVSPGETNSYWTCRSTGRYQLTGHAPEDFGMGCTPDP